MFIIVRLIMGIFLFGCMIVIIKKIKLKYKYIFSAVLSVVLITVSAFLPFENLLVTFNSPEEVYNYMNLGKSNISLVVSGKSCDFVIDNKENLYSYLIVPKSEEGWKIGLGVNTKMISQRVYNNIVIYIYQYRNTDDYFIVLLDTDGGEIELSDRNDSIFYSLERSDAYLNKNYFTYYTNVLSLDTEYWININGEKVSLINK